MDAQQVRQYIWDMRGVETPCRDCDGLGVKTYGSTATWHGGIGGSMMTSAVCDKCWGSGDAHRPWLSHRQALNDRHRLESLSK